MNRNCISEPTTDEWVSKFLFGVCHITESRINLINNVRKLLFDYSFRWNFARIETTNRMMCMKWVRKTKKIDIASETIPQQPKHTLSFFDEISEVWLNVFLYVFEFTVYSMKLLWMWWNSCFPRAGCNIIEWINYISRHGRC